MMKKLKEYYRILGIRFLLYKAYCSIVPILTLKNTRFRTLFWQKKCVNKLKKHVINRYQFPIKKINKKIDKKNIWVLWLQGEKNMPPIVKVCYNSIKKYSDNYNVILLNLDNIAEYIELPDFIIQKYSSGQITNAEFSDLIRIELLATYGGIWIDSTVLLTENISDVIKNSSFFMFQSSKLEYSIIKSSSWFIVNKEPDNYIITSIRNSIYTYWKREKFAINQFVFHLIVSSLYENDKRFKEEWDKIPYICNMNPHLMWFSLHEEFSVQKWKHILNSCGIHKLSWKIEDKIFSDCSIYKYIININSSESEGEAHCEK